MAYLGSATAQTIKHFHGGVNDGQVELFVPPPPGLVDPSFVLLLSWRSGVYTESAEWSHLHPYGIAYPDHPVFSFGKFRENVSALGDSEIRSIIYKSGTAFPLRWFNRGMQGGTFGWGPRPADDYWLWDHVSSSHADHTPHSATFPPRIGVGGDLVIYAVNAAGYHPSALSATVEWDAAITPREEHLLTHSYPQSDANPDTIQYEQTLIAVGDAPVIGDSIPSATVTITGDVDPDNNQFSTYTFWRLWALTSLEEVGGYWGIDAVLSP